MKRYEVYYKDDFGYVVPAIDSEADDGEWVLYEDAQFEIAQLRATLSLAEEGLAVYAQETERLRKRCWVLALLLYPGPDEPREAVAGDIGWPTQAPQSAPIDSVSGNGYSEAHGKDESGTAPGTAREAREDGPEAV